MCLTNDPVHAAASAPVALAADVVDPIALEPVDSLEVVTIVDNVHDALLTSDDRVRRADFFPADPPMAQFADSTGVRGLVAEHGFSALVRVRRGDRTSTVLFDAGLSENALLDNARLLGIDLGEITAVVLSHGHFDHAGGLLGLARARGGRTPMVVHPLAWTRRRFELPGGEFVLPTLSPRALGAEGFELLERRHPSLLLDGCLLVTGEVDRTSDLERGMPPAHQAWNGQAWEHDPLVLDDQAIVVNVRGRGLVVLTGCGHAGVVNIVRHAQRLTGVEALSGLVGGLHLGSPAFHPLIEPTVAALAQWGPDLVVPGHCTGPWAQQAIATALPQAWRPGSSGSTYLWSAA